MLDVLVDCILSSHISVDSFLLLLSLSLHPTFSAAASALQFIIKHSVLPLPLLSQALQSAPSLTSSILQCILQRLCVLQHNRQLCHGDVDWMQFVPKNAEQLETILNELFVLCEMKTRDETEATIQSLAFAFLQTLFSRLHLNPRLVLCRVQLEVFHMQPATVIRYAHLVSSQQTAEFIISLVRTCSSRFDELYLLFCLVAAADYCKQGAAPEAIPVLRSFVSQFATWSNLRFLLYYTRCCFHLTASRCVYRRPAWVVVSETAVDVKTAASFCRSVMKEGCELETIEPVCEILALALLMEQKRSEEVVFILDADDDLCSVLKSEVLSVLALKCPRSPFLSSLLNNTDLHSHSPELWKQQSGWVDANCLKEKDSTVESVPEGEKRLSTLLLHSIQRKKVDLSSLSNPPFMDRLLISIEQSLTRGESCDASIFLLLLCLQSCPTDLLAQFEKRINSLPNNPSIDKQTRFLLSLLRGLRDPAVILQSLREYSSDLIAAPFLFDSFAMKWQTIPVNVLLAVRLLKKPSAFEELICTKRSMKEEEEVEVVQEDTVEEWSGDRKQRRKMQFEKMLKRIDSIAKRNAGKDRAEEREFSFLSPANDMEWIRFVISELLQRMDISSDQELLDWIDISMKWMMEENNDYVVNRIKQDKGTRDGFTSILELVEVVLKRLERDINYYHREREQIKLFLSAVEECALYVMRSFGIGKLGKAADNCMGLQSAICFSYGFIEHCPVCSSIFYVSEGCYLTR